MRKSKFTEEQTAFILKQYEAAVTVEEVRPKMGISQVIEANSCPEKRPA